MTRSHFLAENTYGSACSSRKVPDMSQNRVDDDQCVCISDKTACLYNDIMWMADKRIMTGGTTYLSP